MFSLASRLSSLPVHLFAEVDRRKREAIASGKDVIDLGVGDPDLPTPRPICDALARALSNPKNHRYPYQVGSEIFRDSIARFLHRRYGLHVDPSRQLVPLIGSKEGIAHFPLAFVNPGDVVLGPDPSYPAYLTGTILSGATYHALPLEKSHHFRMQLNTVPPDVLQRSRLIFFNYPNNPTTAPASLSDFQEIASFAKQHNMIAAHDAAYQELYFDAPPPSFLQASGVDGNGIEFHSLSKTFNMTGWRAGFAAGETSLIAGLSRIKSNLDTGLFLAIQDAAAFALDHVEELTAPALSTYRKRRDVVLDALSRTPLKADVPTATIYVWVELPQHLDSMQFALELLDERGVVVTPGSGLGQSARSYFRISLTDTELRLEEAMRRITDFCRKW